VCASLSWYATFAKLDEYLKMKEGSIQVPTFYVGAKLKKIVLPNGVIAWGVRSSKYAQYAVHNIHEYLTALPRGNNLLKKASAPFAWGYKPGLDEIPELDPVMVNFLQFQIGILRWCLELGHIGIITEVLMLSTYLSLSYEGHLDAAFHMCASIFQHHNMRVVFDPTYPGVDMYAFVKTDWKSMYGDVKELLPSDTPVPRGKEVDLRLFFGSDHAGEKFTMHSRTGFVIYLNMAPLVWFSKHHPTLESSVFGDECVAMKNGIETCCGLRYKLRMMGVPLIGPTYVYGDNTSVVHNTQRPESVLKKKSKLIFYHAV
jgi:hypothetical protein